MGIKLKRRRRRKDMILNPHFGENEYFVMKDFVDLLTTKKNYMKNISKSLKNYQKRLQKNKIDFRMMKSLKL